MSGFRPPSEIDTPLGVSQRATVTLSAASRMEMSSCTDPFPKDCSPISVAIPWSRSAPARISDADADPLSIRITTDSFEPITPYPTLLCTMSFFLSPYCSVTTVFPSGKKWLAICTAA